MAAPKANHFALHLGDYLEVMPSLPHGSVTMESTDPPYGLSFMGAETTE